MSKMVKLRVLLILVVLLIGTAFTVCWGSEDTEKTTFGLEPLSERQTIRVGFFSGSPHSLPFYVAEKEGFFNELNIDVEYQSFINGPAMMEAHNSWDIADVGAPGVLTGMIGYDIRMIGVCDYEGNLGLFVRPDSPIARSQVYSNGVRGSAEEWRGTTWLYPIGTNLQMTLATALQKLGLTSADIRSVNMDVTNALTAFKAGEGDGLAVWNVIAFLAEDEGFIRVADAASLDVISTCGLVATEDALTNKRDLLRLVWQVYYLTWEWSNKSPENMQKTIDYFVESCENEGVISSRSLCERALKWFRCPYIKDAIALMTETEPDRLGKYTSRNLLRAENDLLETLDFFIEQGIYTEDQRNFILDNHMVDPSIATESEQMLKSLGILK